VIFVHRGEDTILARSDRGMPRGKSTGYCIHHNGYMSILLVSYIT
jgi:hypothetical protein